MLKEILNKFLILNGVQAAVVIQENGEIIESMKSGIVIDRNLRTALSTIMIDTRSAAAGFNSAPLSMVFAQYSDKFLILGPLAEEFFLVIIAKSTANIGQISYEMKKNQEAIVSLL
ncbi:MAG: roadblock/LC7 domain-containing protein [Methanoregula sp.]|jgi:predicted regulator of Ras-like GTPase activity (Roadblock/LC7/MglB family)|uniref:roadblock/LC7 domain-containing protein n=1 Tax=Methanoregula sp. TaxID=2052170 RepID=UPI003D102F84